MRDFDNGMTVVSEENHGVLMVESEKIGEIIGTWGEADPKCQVANLVPVMSRSGRTLLRVAKECSEAANRYYLVPVGIAIDATVKGYELMPTDSPDWLVADMRQVKQKEIAFRFESIDECCGICVVDLAFDRVREFRTLSEYDIWLNDYDHTNMPPIPMWRNGSYTFADDAWCELRINSGTDLDASPFL